MGMASPLSADALVPAGARRHGLVGTTPRFCSSGLAAAASVTSDFASFNELVGLTAVDVEARISVAASTCRLDLSDCGLLEIPSQVFALTDLVDLSLAGNNITCLPEDIHNLRNLQRLGLAGNALQSLPESIGSLASLQGLWVHGNLLKCLPSQIGELKQLRTLALAGNMLTTLPATLNNLKNLQILSVAGNNLTQIPAGFGSLSSLRVLALYGNFLSHIPDTVANLSSLEELWLQGNNLEVLPTNLEGLISLRQLCIADNKLSSLPDSIGKLQALETLSLYGNSLSRVPLSLQNLQQLQSIWLEGNPFEVDSLRDGSLLPDRLRVGLSSDVKLDLLPTILHRVCVSQIAGTGNARFAGGYFKLQKYNESNPSWKDADLVVVAFGSAPAVPNWGGVLNRIRKEMEASGTNPAYDVLYVVDSWRSWYTQHKDVASSGSVMEASLLGSYYRQELEVALKSYKRVLMLGDSMGASAALLFSPLATSVMAFCPQVDLLSSSIRPGREVSWFHAYKKALLEAVLHSKAHISVHCGSWSHDCSQASLLPENKVVTKVHDVDDHRLARQMDLKGCLVPLVRKEIEKEISHALHCAN